MKRFFTSCCLLFALIQLSACGALSQASEVIQQVSEVKEQIDTIQEQVASSQEEAASSQEQEQAPSKEQAQSDGTFSVEDWIDPVKVSEKLDSLSSYRLVTTTHMVTKSGDDVTETQATYIEERSSDPWLLQIRTLTADQADLSEGTGKIFGDGKIYEYETVDGNLKCTASDLDAEAIRMTQGMARSMAGTMSMMMLVSFGKAQLSESGVVVNGVTTDLYVLESKDEIFAGNGKFWADENGMLIKAETFSSMSDVMETTFTYSLEEIDSFGPINLPASCTP